MLRIFGHFVPVPAVVIGLCEILLTAAAIYLATAPGTQALAGELVQAWIDTGAECP